MAEFSKYKAHSVGMLFDHNNRLPDEDRNRSNEDIDYERTMLNYHLKKGTVEDIKKRLNEIFIMKRNDNVVLGEMIVTLPKNVKSEDERAFFEAVYDFYCEDLGEENIINAVVHKDEHTPHMHLDFVPVIKEDFNINYDDSDNWRTKMLEEWRRHHGNEREIERLCCKDLINKDYLNNMHPRLSKFVEERLGYEVEILNGATINGNKSVSKLKLESLHNEIAVLQKQSDELKLEVSQIHRIAKEWGISENDIGLKPLMELVDDLEKQNKVLREIIERKGYTYSSDELKTISEKKFKPSDVARVSVLDGSLSQAEIDQNAIVVIEIPMKEAPKEPERESSDRTPIGRPPFSESGAERRMPFDDERRMSDGERRMMERRVPDRMMDRTSRGGLVAGTSPQQAFLDKEREASRYIRSASQMSKDIYVKDARMSNRKYVYLKTYENAPEKVINAIIELEKVLREMDDLKERNIYIDRITGDRFDMARSALATLDTHTLYFTRRDLDEKTEDKTIEKAKE